MVHKVLVKALPRLDQFTVPIVNSEVQVLGIKRQEPRGGALDGLGDVKVRFQVLAYKLMRRFKDRIGRWATEQLSTAEVDCQEQSLTTQTYWLQYRGRHSYNWNNRICGAIAAMSMFRSDRNGGPRCGQNVATLALAAASPKREAAA